MPFRSCPFCGLIPKTYKDGKGLKIRCFCGIESARMPLKKLEAIWNERATDWRVGLNLTVMRPDGDYVTGLVDFVYSFDKDFRENAIFAEIGVYAGESTEIFAREFKVVFAIDPWDTLPEIFNGDVIEQHNVGIKWAERQFEKRHKQHKNIIKLKGLDTVFLPSFADNSLDVVYIDGFHDYASVKANILSWYRKIKPGGYLCGHDFKEETPGVRKAVLELLRDPGPIFKDTSWKIQLTENLVKKLDSFYYGG